jgi:hypothetical protein
MPARPSLKHLVTAISVQDLEVDEVGRQLVVVLDEEINEELHKVELVSEVVHKVELANEELHKGELVSEVVHNEVTPTVTTG